MYLLRTNKLPKTLHPNASRGDRCKFSHPQGGPDEEAEDSDDDEDKDQNDRNSGARSSWE